MDAHLQQQQLLQQRQLSAHSTTSELQLEGRQLSGQKPGELLLDQGVAGCLLVREMACCLRGSFVCDSFQVGEAVMPQSL